MTTAQGHRDGELLEICWLAECVFSMPRNKMWALVRDFSYSVECQIATDAQSRKLSRFRTKMAN